MSVPNAKPATIRLSYAPIPRHLWRKWAKPGCLLAIVAIGVSLAREYLDPMLERANLVWAERNSRNFSLPPDTVVFADRMASDLPMGELITHHGVRRCESADRYQRLAGFRKGSLSRYSPTLFTHLMRDANGVERLVILSAQIQTDVSIEQATHVYYVFTLMHAPMISPTGGLSGYSEYEQHVVKRVPIDQRGLRVYAPQMDDSLRSFSFRYDTFDRDGKITVYLKEDGKFELTLNGADADGFWHTTMTSDGSGGCVRDDYMSRPMKLQCARARR